MANITSTFCWTITVSIFTFLRAFVTTVITKMDVKFIAHSLCFLLQILICKYCLYLLSVEVFLPIKVLKSHYYSNNVRT